MKEALDNIVQVRKENQDTYEDNNPYDPLMSQFEGDVEEDVDGVKEIPQTRMPNRRISINEGCSIDRKKTKGNMQGKGNGKAQDGRLGIDAYFAPGTTTGFQPSIKSVLATKEAKTNGDLSLGRWMYNTCILFNAFNSFYFQPMVDAITGIGLGYKVLSYHDMRTHILRQNLLFKLPLAPSIVLGELTSDDRRWACPLLLIAPCPWCGEVLTFTFRDATQFCTGQDKLRKHSAMLRKDEDETL
ncbi:hypothetical protein HHK36_030544 [Tetracentron sinense]|uniref:Uncharacterized protein n=1 Tax=Tetracentron sinense TaxID=13715 RepID=A0A835D0R5_TETSI|nr:hypothetical protein HHK36_030544 [Tetracentron sinense]